MICTPRHFRQLAILLALIPLFLVPGATPDAGAATIRVPADQPTIQAGIDAASGGDTVMVADGTWTGEGNRDLDFGGKAIAVRSHNGPDSCIIDGGWQGHGFILQNAEGESSVIRGFTITRCGISGEPGGGIFCVGSSPMIIGNRIIENRGNGIRCTDGAHPLINDNVIAGNSPYSGAGIYCFQSSPMIINNEIRDNVCQNIGAGNGGGIFCYDAEVVIIGNEITGNIVHGYMGEFWGFGGGLCCYNVTGRIEDNIITGNEADGPGGGILLGASSVVVCNNLVAGNTAGGGGGGIGIETALDATLVGNTIAGNHGQRGGGLYITTGFTGPAPGGYETYTVTSHNNIIWGNSVFGEGDQVFLSNSWMNGMVRLFLGFCDIEGGEPGIVVEYDAQLYTGPGIIDADPLFVTGPGGAYYLSQIDAGQGADSPCVDAGDPTADLPRGTTRTDLVPDQDMADLGFHEQSLQWLVTAPGPGFGNPPEIRVFSPREDTPAVESWKAYGADHYGANVTCGDVTGDGFDEIITGAGPGPIYGAHVRGFDSSGWPLPGLSFFAYNTPRWGVNVAAGDVDNDGYDEIVTGAGPGPVFGPHVRVWDYDNSGTVTPWSSASWFAYNTPRWGVNVACGDLDGDGFDEIVTGPGPGNRFGSHVRGWDIDGGSPVPMPGVSFFNYPVAHGGGAIVSCGDIDADGIDEIVCALGPLSSFDGTIICYNADGGSVSQVPNGWFFAWPQYETRYGARVYAGADLDSDGLDEVIVGLGPDPEDGCLVRVYNFATGEPELWLSLDAYPGMTMGASVAGGVFQP